MPVFREVEVYPHGGPEHASWVPWNADDGAFARRARGICLAYSESLPSLGLTVRASMLRLSCDTESLRPDARRPRPQFDDPPDGAVVVIARFIESMEDGMIFVPAGFADAPIEVQLGWTLDVIHEAARQLVRLRGGDPDRLRVARQHVEAQGMRFTYAAPWKNSPDRRHRARLVAGVDEHGVTHVRIEAATRAGDIVAVWEASTSGYREAGFFKRLARTIRWDGYTVTASGIRLHIPPAGPAYGESVGLVFI